MQRCAEERKRLRGMLSGASLGEQYSFACVLAHKALLPRLHAYCEAVNTNVAKVYTDSPDGELENHINFGSKLALVYIDQFMETTFPIVGFLQDSVTQGLLISLLEFHLKTRDEKERVTKEG